MHAWRIRVAWIVLVGGLTPAILAYAAAMVRVRSDIAIVTDDGPNPAKSPGALGPVEALVYLDPTWAGTALIWMASSVGLVVAFAIAAAVFWPSESSARAILRLRLAAFATGMPLAWPWISVLLRG